MNAYKTFNLMLVFVFAFSLLGMPAPVSAQEYSPSIGVVYNQDAVAMWEWKIGVEATLTIDNPDNGPGVDYTTSMIIDEPDPVFYVVSEFDIQPGDVVTVTDAEATKTVVVSNVRVLGVNLDTDTVYGGGDPFHTISLSVGCVWQVVTADNIGNWSVDFTGICNITDTTGFTAIEIDEDNDVTRFDFTIPTFSVQPENNRVYSSGWLLGNEVTLTIDNPANGAGADFTVTKTPLPLEWDRNQTYIGFDLGAFETHPGDLVTMTDGITTKKTVVTNLVFGGGNVINNKVWGTADPGTVIQVLFRDDYNVFRKETADADRNWTADFSVPGDEPGEEALFDIQPENVMLANQKDEDGDQTQLEWHAPDPGPVPSIAADVNQDAVALWNWATGTELTLTIDTPANGIGVDYSTSMILDPDSAAFYIGSEFDIQVGDFITVTDGTSTRQVTVTFVRILGVNLDTNTVYGEADPFDTIGVSAYGYQNCDWQGLEVAADQNGNWVADFTGICNLTGVTTIGASKQDNGVTRFFLNIPTFTVYPQNNRVDSREWLVGNEVTLTIDSAANGAGVDYTDTKITDGYHFDTYIDFDLGTFETHPGDLVTMTDGITTKKTVVANLTLDSGNIINDKVWGTANSGTVIRVSYRDDYNIFRNVTADTQRNWIADFSVLGDEPGEEGLFDIQPENVMLANQKDEDGDQTQLEWHAPYNQPPVADAGGSYTVYASGMVTLDASASSDPDGDTLIYEWDLDNDGQYDNAGGVTITTSFNQIGDHTIGLRVTDDGRLSDTDTATVTVLPWTLKGFYQPVDMNGVYNVVKGGSAVPLKFEILAGTTELTDTAFVKSLTYAQTSCDSTAVTDEIETITSGGTSLRYDTQTDQYIYNWKTPKTAGKCYRVTMTTIDGSSLVAYFKLK